MNDYLTVFTGVIVEDGCPMRFYPLEDGDITFVIGHSDRDVELIMSPDSINRFVAVAAEALAAEQKAS